MKSLRLVRIVRWLLACILLLACSSQAWAAGGPRVVLVTDADAKDEDVAIARRLRAEFTASGFEVISRTSPTASRGDPSSLPELTSESDALAGVLVAAGQGSEQRIWLWIAQSNQRPSSMVEMKREEGDGELLALGAIEYMESSFFELLERERKSETEPEDEAATEPPAAISSDPEADAEAPKEGADALAEGDESPWAPPRASLGVGAGLLLPFAGLPPTARLRFTFRRHFAAQSRLHAGLGLGTTVPPMRLTFEGGSTALTLIDADAQFGFSLRTDKRVVPSLAAAIGPAFAFARESTQGGSDQTAIGQASLELGLAVGITPTFRVRWGARVGALLPKLQVADSDGSPAVAQLVFDLSLALQTTWRGRK